jgi:hypothetical protein
MDDLTSRSQDSRWFKGVLLAGMLLFAFYASTHMVAAGDTWVAMACGRHFANHGVDNVEPFSFNSHPPGPSEESLSKFPKWSHGIIKTWHPTGWIDQNWLTQLIFFKLTKWAGSNGEYNYNTLVYWKFFIYFLTVGCVYAIGRILGAGPIFSAAGACMAMVVGRTFFDIRPAGYSNLLVPAFILVLVLTTYRNYRLIWLFVPLVVFWANVHGGYLYAFFMMVPCIGIHILLRMPKRWSICLGFVGLWLVLYLMSYKFISNTYYQQVQRFLGHDEPVVFILKDKLLLTCLILAAISIVITCIPRMKSGPFYAYHIGANIIYFLSIATRLFSATIPQNLSSQFNAIYSSFVRSSQISFLFVFVIAGFLVLAMALKKDRFTALPVSGIYHTFGAAVATFFAMIILNPFHLTNLTHTFEISVSEHAESWRQVNEWKPAFDWMDKTTSTPNPVGEEEWFAVLCIVVLSAILVWLTAYFLKPQLERKTGRKIQKPEPDAIPFEWPKIDLAIIVISLLTLYMAIRSRRFIAIAGSAAAPVTALFMVQCWQMITARISWTQKGVLRPMTLPRTVYTFIQAGIVLVLLVLGIYWGAKYKRIYLDPWPTDDRYSSIFMRMTASHLKPFEVCKFINDNNISGRVFNYWTEGGAVAFGQTPNPETGHIPLKLFMDGRAQAAYNHDKFRLWQLIHSGGPAIQQARAKGDKITSKILTESGQWIDQQLKNRKVWVVLMPQTQSSSIFMKALKRTDNWKTAYVDNTQHLIVDTDTAEGQALIHHILNDTAVFPDAFSKNLTTATVIIETKARERFAELYDLLSTVFEKQPNPVIAITLTQLYGIPTFREKVDDLFQAYLDDFEKNQEVYRETDGFALRLSCANIAARFLAKVNPKASEDYGNQVTFYQNKIRQINTEAIW